MRKSPKTLAVAAALVAALAAATTLYAHESQDSGGSMMGPDMMGQGDMMGMMGRMSVMMETCNRMMQGTVGGQGSEKPGEQRQQEAPGKNR
ncbi:MAG: hypothetical protein HY521_10660 [Proteobacteria bacterium]|nr:hypothetical protein [Pseudomonadota bacterium]